MKKFLFLSAAFCLCAAGYGRAPLNAANAGDVIIAFGDSLTAGNGARADEAYPAALESMVKMPVINMGVSGDTARMGANRMREMAQYRPYMVLIEFGGNDAIRGRPFRETQTAIAEIIDYVQKLGAAAVVVDTGGNFKMSPYTKMMKTLAKQKRALFVEGIMDGIFHKPQLKSDAIHPNAAGYRLIAEKIYKEIKPYLK
ncbi:MAG: GDSL-type esterase/lipase family protein [Elusimicrobiota bacterium]|jgi:lysophospholipase L1-like esterase|nr:GDSL-type esterase/lipase family protein [Elusimicrobiota bacterium]